MTRMVSPAIAVFGALRVAKCSMISGKVSLAPCGVRTISPSALAAYAMGAKRAIVSIRLNPISSVAWVAPALSIYKC